MNFLLVIQCAADGTVLEQCCHNKQANQVLHNQISTKIATKYVDYTVVQLNVFALIVHVHKRCM